ncbi:MAG: hypothetical protein V1663_04860 [archaeon]
MKKEELVSYAREYIVEQLSNGFSLQDIKKKLIEFGYTQDVIEEALNYKEGQRINELNDDIRKLRIDNSYLKRDIDKLKNEKSGINLLLVIFLLLVFTSAAFSFGFMFKNILNKDYVGLRMCNDTNNISDGFIDTYGYINNNLNDNGNNESNLSTGDIINENSNLNNEPLSTCSSLNGYNCNYNEICNGNTFESSEGNCCSVQCEMMQCIYFGCNSPNMILPCKCGNSIADFDNLWCCASSNLVFSGFQNENCIFCGGLLLPPGSFE